MKIYTIGHSAHPIERFINLLKMYNIQTIVDVRSVPHSRYHPQFRKGILERELNAVGIGYVFLGQKLGGRPDDPDCYPEGVQPSSEIQPWPKPDYEKVMAQAGFQEGIVELLEIVSQKRTVILCSEENPASCHRHGLIALYLKRNHPEIQIMHIRGNGVLVEAAEIDVQTGQQSSFL